MLYFIAQIWDLCFGDLREDFPLFCYLFPEAPSFCAGIWSSWTCVTAAGDAARRFYICIYCSALLFNFVVLVLAQRRSDANEGWIIWVADKQTPATPRAEAGGGGGRGRRAMGSISPCSRCSSRHPTRAAMEGQQPGPEAGKHPKCPQHLTQQGQEEKRRVRQGCLPNIPLTRIMPLPVLRITR